MNNIMTSLVTLLENIKPSVSVDPVLFERKESTPTNEHQQYSFTVELPRAVSPSRKVIFSISLAVSIIFCIFGISF